MSELSKLRPLGNIVNTPAATLGASREKSRSTLGEIVSAGCTLKKGGHLLWKHESLRVRPAGRNYVQVHRALFESVHGPISNGFFLLNTCGVESCIAPDCFILSRYSSLRDHVAWTHVNRCEFKRIPKHCEGLQPEQESTCVPRH